MLIIDQRGQNYYFWNQDNVPRQIFNLSLEIFQPTGDADAIQLRCNIKESDTQCTLGIFKNLNDAVEVLRYIFYSSDDSKFYRIPED